MCDYGVLRMTVYVCSKYRYEEEEKQRGLEKVAKGGE